MPALCAAVAAYTDCVVKFTDEPGVEVVDDRPAVPNYKVTKKEEGDEAIAIVKLPLPCCTFPAPLAHTVWVNVAGIKAF